MLRVEVVVHVSAEGAKLIIIAARIEPLVSKSNYLYDLIQLRAGFSYSS